MRVPFPKANLAQWAKEITDYLNFRLSGLFPTIPLLGRRQVALKGTDGQIVFNSTSGQVQVFYSGTWNNTSRVPVYTFAAKPAASSVPVGTLAFISDGANETGTGNMVFSDGTNWRRVDNGATAGT